MKVAIISANVVWSELTIDFVNIVKIQNRENQKKRRSWFSGKRNN